MIRIFTTLALFAVLMMSAAMVVGLYVGDHVAPDAQALRWASIHRLLGVAAAIVVILVDSIVMTYFIGTSRWCKEVMQAYQLDAEFVTRSVSLKRRTFPWAFLSMLVVIAVGALGAAADPSTMLQGTEHWVIFHLLGAFLGLAFIALSFYIQGRNIAAHHVVIEEIVAQVRRIRAELGLEV